MILNNHLYQELLIINDRNLKSQHVRRTSKKRIDYYPSSFSQAVISAKRTQYAPCNNNSGILDTILAEWAELTGIKYCSFIPDMTSGHTPELLGASTRARMTSVMTCQEFDGLCHAKTKTGKPCQSRPCPGNVRCKWHGGMSTGPKSTEGKAKSLANLRQNRGKQESND